jgi:hypothetical protein
MRDDALLDELRARLPVSEVVGKRVRLKHKGRELVGLSPFNKERTPSFFVNDQKGFYHDFSSGKHGDIFNFVMETEGLPFRDAVDQLAAMAGLTPQKARQEQKRDPHREQREQRERDRRAAEREEQQQRDEAIRAEKAAGLWSMRKRITPGTPVDLYLRKRGFTGVIPPTLAWLPASEKYGPSMIAAFGLCTEIEPQVIEAPVEVHGVHITNLDTAGNKAAIETIKTMFGPSKGLPITLLAPNDLLGMAITEGLEDGLTVLQMNGYAVWCAGDAGRMPALAPVVPWYIECVTIFAHADHAGERNAYELADALDQRGIEVFIEGI